MKKYEISELAIIFRKQAENNSIKRHRDIEVFQKMLKDEKLPDHYFNDFDLSAGLASICEHLLQKQYEEIDK